MSNDSNIQNLASALSKSGVACSASQAMNMAKSIMGTDKRVSSHFDKQNNKIEKSLDKRSYQEEIDDLIEKTSPEKKDFHVMVSGYKKEPHFKEVDSIIVDKKEPEKKIEQNESIKKTINEPILKESISVEKEEIKEVEEIVSEPVAEEKRPEIMVEEIKEESIAEGKPEMIKEQAQQEPKIEESAVQEVPIVEEKPIEPVMINQPIEKPVEPTNNNVLDDKRMLKDIMDEQAKEIYTNKPEEPKEIPDESLVAAKPIPEEVVHPTPQPVSNAPKDDFILDVKEEVVEQEVPKPEKKVFANPIEEVDLLDHFKF